MAAPLNCAKKCINRLQCVHMQVRTHTFKTHRPRPKPIPRQVFEIVTKPMMPEATKILRYSCADPSRIQEKEANPYEEFLIRQFTKEMWASEMIIICHLQPCPAVKFNRCRMTLRQQDIKLSFNNNKHMKALIKDTHLANLAPLLCTNTARITCKEVKIKQLITSLKKFPELVITGGFVGDRLVTKDSLIELSKLPEMDQLLGQLVATLNTAAGGRTLSLLNSHQQTLSRNLTQYVAQGTDKSDSNESDTSGES